MVKFRVKPFRTRVTKSWCPHTLVSNSFRTPSLDMMRRRSIVKMNLNSSIISSPWSSALYSPAEGAVWRQGPETELPSSLNHCPRAAAQGWRSAPMLHKTCLISNHGHSHFVSHILSKERESELLNTYSLHSRGGKKKRKPVQNCSYHYNTTNKLWGRNGETPGRRKAWTKKSIKWNRPEERQGGSGQKWNETPRPKRPFRWMGM